MGFSFKFLKHFFSGQSLDELVDAYGIVTLFKDDGLKEKTDRRLNDFNGLMYGNDVDFASVPSTATDSEDEWAMWYRNSVCSNV